LGLLPLLDIFMRWFLIDRFIEIQKGEYAKAIRNITLGEDHLHDHFPTFPVMPNSLIIESLAQTAGILAGYSRDFEQNVILSKITKAVFHRMARPGDQLILEAQMVDLRDEGAWLDATATVDGQLQAEASLMFVHWQGELPLLAGRPGRKPGNFVFNEEFVSFFWANLAPPSLKEK
jgi:3-hydroxyacyl-[acyl-carrier-protein] dehydratase